MVLDQNDEGGWIRKWHLHAHVVPKSSKNAQLTFSDINIEF